MKGIRYKFLLSFILLTPLISCTEKVSDEVEQEEAAKKNANGPKDFRNKAMRLVDKNDPNLSFLLHKSGTLSSPCELKAPSNGFSASSYDKTSKIYTADCILDAEELDIFFHGVKFDIQVDEFLCEYVQYKPYRFFQFQPGSSSLRRATITCDETCEENFPGICGTSYRTINGTPPSSIDPSTLSTYFQNPYDEASNPLLCHFDYDKRTSFSTSDPSGKYPNCDTGSITTYPYRLLSKTFQVCTDGTLEESCADAGKFISDESPEVKSCNAGAGGASLVRDPVERELCGGLNANCIAGAGTKDLPSNKSSIIYNNEDLNSFSKSYTYDSPLNGDYNSSMNIVNFSRICSSTSESKTDAKFDTNLFEILGHEVEDIVLNNYLDYNSITGTYPAANTYSYDDNGDGDVDYTAYGVHPFNNNVYYHAQQPYYAFNCLDKARDIKAQIRLFIREWDRKFEPTNPYVARLSDINQSIPLMDADGLQQIGEPWNDAYDWDNYFEDVSRGSSSTPLPAFLNNQCKSLTVGFCTDNVTTDQVSCILNGETWKTEDYCSDPSYTSFSTCIGNGHDWIFLEHLYSSNKLYPGIGL